MGAALRKLIGVLALVLAVPTLGTVAVLVASALGGRLPTPSFWSANLGLIYAVGAVLTVALYASLWLLARPRAGAWLLLLAALVLLANYVGVMVLVRWVPANYVDTLLQTFNWAGIASIVCLSVGLWLTGLLRGWVTGAAVACAILRVAQSLVPLIPAFDATNVGLLLAAGSVFFEVFLFGVAITMLVD